MPKNRWNMALSFDRPPRRHGGIRLFLSDGAKLAIMSLAFLDGTIMLVSYPCRVTAMARHFLGQKFSPVGKDRKSVV